MNFSRKINILLRLADLCSADENLRRQNYMDQIDALLVEEAECELDQIYEDPTLSFLEEKTIRQMNGRVKRADVYKAYVNYCFSNNMASLSRNALYTEIRGLGYGEIKSHNGYYYFVGFELKEE